MPDKALKEHIRRLGDYPPEPDRYRGWLILQVRHGGFPQFEFWHENYGGDACDCGYGSSYEDCASQIDEREDER